MSIREKTRRRLLILVSGVFLTGTLLAAAYFVRTGMIQRQVRAYKTQGMEEYSRGDYRPALKSLGQYLTRHPTDVEALYAYAVSRRNVQEPEGKNLGQAIGLFRRVMELAPEHERAAQDLLDLYTKVGFATEAVALADKLLARHKDNTGAIRSKALALARLRQPRQALVLAHELVRLEPDNLDDYFFVLALLRGLDPSPSAIMTQVDQWAKGRQDDARILLLRGFALELNQKRNQAKECLMKAAANARGNVKVLERVVGLLDASGQYMDSLKILVDQVKPDSPVEFRRLLVTRLAETDQVSRLMDETAKLDLGSPDCDVQLMSLRALTQIRTGHPDDARAAIKALQARSQPMAEAWANMLRLLLPDEKVRPAERVRIARDCLAVGPSNPFFHFFLAESYMILGELEMAQQSFIQAGDLAPGWYLPMQRAAEVSLAQGRTHRAVLLASSAVQRAPFSPAVALTLAVCQAGKIKDSEVKALGELAELLTRITQALPGEPRARRLLAITQARRKNAAGLREALMWFDAKEHSLDESTARILEVLDRKNQLGVAERLAALKPSIPRTTPAALLDRAMDLHEAGKTDEGFKLLQAHADKAEAAQRLTWEMTLVQYLDRTGSQGALQAWMRIVDENPDNTQLIRMAIDSPVVWSNRDFCDKAISRLRTHTGEQALAWRMLRARWLLTGSLDPKDQAQAITLLNDFIRMAPEDFTARMAMAMALERSGNHALAITHLQTAAQLNPDSPAPILGQAQIHQKQGDVSRAVQALTQLSADAVAPADARRVATMWASLGKPDLAIAWLQKAGAQDTSAVGLPLASLYLQAGQADKAEEILQRLLEKPAADTIQSAAVFYALRGDLERARQVLAKLDPIKLDPGIKAMILGGFHAQFVDVNKAEQFFTQATQEASGDRRTWVALMRLLASLGKTERLLAVARQAAAALPDDKGIAALAKASDLVKVAMTVAPARSLIPAIVASDEVRPIALDAMGKLRDAWKNGPAPGPASDALRPLADLYPRFFELQVLVVRLFTAAGRHAEAISLAGRTAQLFPSAPEPCQLLTQSCASAGNWAEALAAAREWRIRSAADPTEADMAISESLLHLGNAGAALAHASPYLRKAMAEPDGHAQVILTNVRALVASDQVDKAAALLEPLLAKDVMWRVSWLRLAALAIRDHALAVQWLEKVTPLISSAGADQRAALAEAWNLLGLRTRSESDRARARLIYQTLASDPGTDAQTTLACAMFFDSINDVTQAELSYRKSLQNTPSAVAMNNLAMILIRKKSDTAQAVDLARKAVQLGGTGQPAFLDTLAQAQLLAGKPHDAAESLRKAVAIDPYNPAWLIRLAQALRDEGKLDDARHVIAQIRNTFPDAKSLPADLQQMYEDLQKVLSTG